MDSSPDARQRVNVCVRRELLAAAREARINLSALLDRALTEELVRLKWLEWRRQNAAAIAAYNGHVTSYGTFSRICLRL
ncbi:MAG TPA: type II toxin-antitoxin system CcdA family antitoxin [Steroidobacteraceae bacterium]|nr:type II toxin-antitoxin system CcdA family antitoxin [Steroidobacteraceae bacterium]